MTSPAPRMPPWKLWIPHTIKMGEWWLYVYILLSFENTYRQKSSDYIELFLWTSTVFIWKQVFRFSNFSTLVYIYFAFIKLDCFHLKTVFRIFKFSTLKTVIGNRSSDCRTFVLQTSSSVFIWKQLFQFFKIEYLKQKNPTTRPHWSPPSEEISNSS